MEILAFLIISEIMFNPASREALPVTTEWVEIYNPSDAEVDISGWYLEDEDGKTQPIPAGTKLGAKQAVVLVPSEQTVEGFRAAWGDDVAVIPLGGWGKPGLTGLGNEPSDKNEILKLMRKDDSVSDTVNFDDEGDWPVDDPQGPSIYLSPDKLTPDANDAGTAWRRSEPGVLGAKNCKTEGDFSSKDAGSPGVVITE